MSCDVINSYDLQDLFEQNLCWTSARTWCFSKWVMILLTMMCSFILQMIDVRETGLLFAAVLQQPFLNTIDT